MTSVFIRHTDAERYELRPRGAATVHVLRGVPDGRLLPQGYKLRFTLAANPAGTSPLVARRPLGSKVGH